MSIWSHNAIQQGFPASEWSGATYHMGCTLWVTCASFLAAYAALPLLWEQQKPISSCATTIGRPTTASVWMSSFPLPHGCCCTSSKNSPLAMLTLAYQAPSCHTALPQRLCYHQRSRSKAEGQWWKVRANWVPAGCILTPHGWIQPAGC